MAAIFVGMLSKELFTIVVAAAVALGLSRNTITGWVIAVGALVAYALGVRLYWLATLAYAVGLGVLVGPRRTLAAKLAAALLLVVVASAALHIVTGFYLTDVRIVMNVTRIDDPNVVSMVLNPLANTSVITDVVNHFWAWLNFVLPVRLLASAVPQQVAFAVWQIANLPIIGIALWRARTWLPRNVQWALASFVVAVTIVLAAFDGDFGTYTRHQIMLLPVVGFILGVPQVQGEEPSSVV